MKSTAVYAALARERYLLLLAAVLFVFYFTAGDLYMVSVANETLMMAIISVSFCLLLGNAGQISLGHAGFFALSGYVSAILTASFAWQPAAALAAGLTISISLALLVAIPLLRLRGHHLAIATLGFGLIVQTVLTNEVAWTGGPDGMSVPVFAIAGVAFKGERVWFCIFGFLLLANLWISQNVLNSPVGRALRSLHGSEIAAQICGVNVSRYKVFIFVYSAAIAALIGSLAAHYSGSIAPSAASFLTSFKYIMAVVIGGLTTPFGAVLGSVVVIALPSFFVGFGEYETLLFGLVLLSIMVFLPKGLLPSAGLLLRSNK